MSEFGWVNLVAAPIGLGLLGFLEPCSLGSTWVFVKLIEGTPPRVKARQVMVFAVVRGIVMGLLGLAATFIGAAFFGLQRSAWLLFGLAYVVLGALYVARRADFLYFSLGAQPAPVVGTRASALTGLLFALNVPACAAPLLLALLGAAAAGGATGSALASGFVSLGLFGLALSLPLVVVAFVPRARGALDWLAGFGQRAPVVTGVVLIALGLWSVWFGVFVQL